LANRKGHRMQIKGRGKLILTDLKKGVRVKEKGSIQMKGTKYKNSKMRRNRKSTIDLEKNIILSVGNFPTTYEKAHKAIQGKGRKGESTLGFVA